MRLAFAVMGAALLPLAIESIQLAATPLGRACQGADVVDNLARSRPRARRRMDWHVDQPQGREAAASRNVSVGLRANLVASTLSAPSAETCNIATGSSTGLQDLLEAVCLAAGYAEMPLASATAEERVTGVRS